MHNFLSSRCFVVKLQIEDSEDRRFGGVVSDRTVTSYHPNCTKTSILIVNYLVQGVEAAEHIILWLCSKENEMKLISWVKSYRRMFASYYHSLTTCNSMWRISLRSLCTFHIPIFIFPAFFDRSGSIYWLISF